MYAIFEDSGTQVRVEPDDVIELDPRPGKGDPPKTLTFDRVLLVGGGDKNSATIGTPYIEGATVTAEVLEAVLGKKIDVIKFKRRKGYKRKYGHRQPALRVRITTINAP